MRVALRYIVESSCEIPLRVPQIEVVRCVVRVPKREWMCDILEVLGHVDERSWEMIVGKAASMKRGYKDRAVERYLREVT